MFTAVEVGEYHYRTIESETIVGLLDNLSHIGWDITRIYREEPTKENLLTEVSWETLGPRVGEARVWCFFMNTNEHGSYLVDQYSGEVLGEGATPEDAVWDFTDRISHRLQM